MMYMIKSKSNIEKVREKVRKLKNEIKRLEIEKSITKFPMSDDEIPIFQIISSKKIAKTTIHPVSFFMQLRNKEREKFE